MTRKKTLGIIGLGSFGKLMVQYLSPYFSLCAYDISNESKEYAKNNNVDFLSIEEVAKSDIVVLSIPVPVMENVLNDIKDYVKKDALILDVGSVKTKPAKLMQEILPNYVDIIGTHPLFGPVGSKNGTKGLKMVLCPLRGENVNDKMSKITGFLHNNFGLDLIESTPKDHDKEMAYVQGLPHMIAKILIDMEPLPRLMVTPNYKHFLRSIDVVRLDTDDLFQAILKDNPYTKEVRDIFFEKANKLRYKIDG